MLLATPDHQFMPTAKLSARAYKSRCISYSWKPIWEAGDYYARISELLEQAQDYAVFVGWQIDSRTPLVHPSSGQIETLKEKMVRICESRPNFHFYLLMWDHAYFYTLEREILQGRIWDNVHPRIHFVFDNRAPYGGSHHEKIAIVDGRYAFTGGIDICDERWDSPQHLFIDRRRSLDWKEEHHGPYHDLAVEVTGPICQEVQEHVEKRWKKLSSIPFPKLPLAHETTPKVADSHSLYDVYLSRTIAEIEGGDERGVPIIREIEFLTMEMIQQAEHRLILEGQYYWSEKLNDTLIKKIHQMRGKDFEVFLILADTRSLKSLSKQMAYYELKLIKKLQDAARFSKVRLVMGTPRVKSSDGKTTRPIYVHSKIIIVDDIMMSIGSANFAARAYRLDTELNLTIVAKNQDDRAFIEKTAHQVLGHWNLQSVTRSYPQEVQDPTVINGPQVELRAFDPLRDSKEIRLAHPWLSRIPWQYFFDPEVPWLYPLKRRFRNWSVTRSWLAFSISALTWALGLLLTIVLVGPTPDETQPWSWAYLCLLYSVWVLPVPFLPLALFATLHLEEPIASQIIIFSFWTASIWGYTVARMFPNSAARFYRETGQHWLPQRLGLRSFPHILSVLMDPRVNLRSKIVYQGLYCVHFPWFILGTLLGMGSLLYMLIRLTHLAAIQIGANVESYAPIACGISFLWGTAYLVFGLDKVRKEQKSGKTKATSTVVQYT